MWAGKTVAVLPTLAPPPLLKLMAMETGVELVITSEEFAPALLSVGMQCWIGDASAEFEPGEIPQQPNQSGVAALLYTSGTTGRPKAVALSEANIIANIDGLKQATGYDQSQVMIAALPLEGRDTKGDLYEYMLSKIATAGQNGQFRTPRHIIQLMVELTQPTPKDIVCDPACGTAGFLVAACSAHPA